MTRPIRLLRMSSLLFIGALGCRTTSTAWRNAGDYCSLAAAATNAAIDDAFRGQGLDAMCVGQIATVSHKVNVDFVTSPQLGQPPTSMCEEGRFVIRPARSSSAAPTASVVYLTAERTPTGISFEASVMPSTWREDFKKRVLPISPCGVIQGQIKRVGQRWVATTGDDSHG